MKERQDMSERTCAIAFPELASVDSRAVPSTCFPSAKSSKLCIQIRQLIADGHIVQRPSAETQIQWSQAHNDHQVTILQPDIQNDTNEIGRIMDASNLARITDEQPKRSGPKVSSGCTQRNKREVGELEFDVWHQYRRPMFVAKWLVFQDALTEAKPWMIDVIWKHWHPVHSLPRMFVAIANNWVRVLQSTRYDNISGEFKKSVQLKHATYVGQCTITSR